MDTSENAAVELVDVLLLLGRVEGPADEARERTLRAAIDLEDACLLVSRERVLGSALVERMSRFDKDLELPGDGIRADDWFAPPEGDWYEWPA